MDSELEKESGAPASDDDRESCLMCGACEAQGQVCVLTATLRKD